MTIGVHPCLDVHSKISHVSTIGKILTARFPERPGGHQVPKSLGQRGFPQNSNLLTNKPTHTFPSLDLNAESPKANNLIDHSASAEGLRGYGCSRGSVDAPLKNQRPFELARLVASPSPRPKPRLQGSQHTSDYFFLSPFPLGHPFLVIETTLDG